MVPKTPKKPAKDKHVNFPLRADDPTIQRIERVKAWIERKNPWLAKATSHALRTILLKGLDAVEIEMAADPAPKKKVPRG